MTSPPTTPDACLVRVVDASSDIHPSQLKNALLVRLVDPPLCLHCAQGDVVYPLAMPKGASPFRICASGSVPPNGGILSFDNRPYNAGGIQWNFPVTVPADTEFWVTDLHFQSKMVRHPDYPLDDRSSYAVFFGIMTMTEHCSFASYRSPIRLPAGYVISGNWINQSAESQNMIAAMHGYVIPLT